MRWDVCFSHDGFLFAITNRGLCNNLNCLELLGEQGWRSGESARLPPMCPGFYSRTWHHMWAEFVGSLLCFKRFFSRNSGFPLSSKTNI